MSRPWGYLPLYEGGVLPLFCREMLFLAPFTQWLCWNVNPGFPGSRNATALTPWVDSWPLLPAPLLAILLIRTVWQTAS